MEIIFYLVLLLCISSIIFFIFYFKRPNSKSSLKDLYAEGLDLLVTGKRNAAYKNFKLIIEKDSSNIKAFLHLGQVVREGGSPKKALEIHKNLLIRKDINKYDKIELYKNLSLDYYQNGNPEKSIEYCKMILKFDSFNDWAIKQLIKQYKEIHEWESATEYLKNYFKLINKYNNKKLALYRIQEGRVKLKNKEYDDSRRIFEEAFELNPDLHICYFFLGNTFAQQSNEVYDKAISIKQNGDGSLEKTDQSQKNIVNAEEILSQAIPMWGHFIENMPDYSWMILPILKDALQALNKYDQIEDILIKAKNKNQNDLDIVSHLADFYANKGDIDTALTTINAGLEKNSNSLIAQLKKIKIKALKNKETDLSIEIDQLIVSLLRDERYIKYKQSYNDENMKWLFEIHNIS